MQVSSHVRVLKTDCQKFDLSLIGDEKLCLPRALTIPSPSSLLSSPYRSLPSLRVGISQYSPQQLDTIPRNSHESSPTHHDEALSRTNSLHDSLWDGALPVLEENLEITEEFITKEFIDSTLFSEAIPFILHEPITIELNPQYDSTITTLHELSKDTEPSLEMPCLDIDAEHIDMNSKMYTQIENLVGNSIASPPNDFKCTPAEHSILVSPVLCKIDSLQDNTHVIYAS